MKGLSFVTPKLPGFVEKIKILGQEKTPVLYCWRGGMRSKSVQDLLETLQIPSRRLKGGYKSYRRFILDRLNSYQLKTHLCPERINGDRQNGSAASA